jgi:hypothetical protein
VVRQIQIVTWDPPGYVMHDMFERGWMRRNLRRGGQKQRPKGNTTTISEKEIWGLVRMTIVAISYTLAIGGIISGNIGHRV